MEQKLISASRKTKYPLDAFIFVHNGLDFTVQQLHGKKQEGTDSGSRHVTGRDLCIGLRDFAIKQYGLMARPVLSKWNIHKTTDFGHIVFALIDAGLMLKTADDSLEDFDSIYDFSEALCPDLVLGSKA